MTTELIWLIAAVALLWLLTAVHFRRQVKSFQRAPGLTEAPDHATSVRTALPEDYQRFLSVEGYQFAAAYSFHQINLGLWIRVDAAPPLRIFVLTLAHEGQPPVCDFVSVLSDDASLNTTNTSVAFLFSRRFGRFTQSFPNYPADRLWDLHQQGEAFVITKLKIDVSESRIPFPTAFRIQMESMLSQTMSAFCWPGLLAYRFWVGRFFLHRRPIWRQDLMRIYRPASPR